MDLIVGANSLIGGALARSLAAEAIPFAGTSRHPAPGKIALDLSEPPHAWSLPAGNVETAYLCAAQTGLKNCEDHPRQSALINVERTVELARQLCDRGVFVIFLSTNLVFDGTKPHFKTTDIPNPTTEYGRQKAQAEKALLEIGGIAVVRLTKVVHAGMNLFQAWVASLRSGQPIHPFRNLKFSPIPLDDTVEALKKIGRLRMDGIVHLSADTDISYEDCARILQSRMQTSPSLVQPSDEPKGAPFTALDTGDTAGKLGIKMPPARECMDAIFRQMLSV